MTLIEVLKIEEINEYTCIQGVPVALSKSDKNYYPRALQFHDEVSKYHREVYLKKPGAMEVIDCKDERGIFSIPERAGSILDIKVEGLGEEAARVAMIVYDYVKELD